MRLVSRDGVFVWNGCVHHVAHQSREARFGFCELRSVTKEGGKLDSPSNVHSKLDPTLAMGITADRGLRDVCPRLELIELLGGRDHLGDARELSAARFAAGEGVRTDAHKQAGGIQGWAQ